MSIDKKLRDSFSEITPPTKNEAIVRHVIERADKMDKNNNNSKCRMNRMSVIIIAAATAVVAGTVTVGSATGWSFNPAFNQASKVIADNNGSHYVSVYSPEEAETKPSEAAPVEVGANAALEEAFDYLSGGRELDLWYSLDNFKLNIKGVCADSFAAYVLYDIIFDSDFNYSPKEGWTAWEPVVIPEAIDKALDEQPELGMACSFSHGVISKEGNVLHCYTMPKLFNEYTWDGKTMTLDFISIRRYIPSRSEKDEQLCTDYEELSFGENGLTVEIPIDFPIFESTLWEINKPLDLSADEHNKQWLGNKQDCTLKYFSASPLSYSFYVEADTSGFSKGDYYYLTTSINAGDSAIQTVFGEGQIWNDDGGQGEVGIFAQPIAPSDITSITVCGQTFELG